MLATKGFRILQLVAAFLISSVASCAQNTKVITGKITDAKGNGLPSVSVVDKGTSIEAVTNSDGAFTLTAPSSLKSISVNSVGFTEQEVSPDNGNEINIVLRDNMESLNDVVVLGYGTARKKDLTGAVSNIST